MTQRNKLELEINKPIEIELLYNDCVSGTSQYGVYNLYAVKCNGSEFSFFAPDEVHTELIKLNKGDLATITKQAIQRGNKIETSYDVQIPNKVKAKGKIVTVGEAINEILPEHGKEDLEAQDKYYTIMKQSYSDALQINSELNGITADVARLCITLFIARSKTI